MSILRISFVTTALLLTLSAAHAQELANQLLPESFTRTIAFTWRQDGRLLEIQVTNPTGRWLLQELILEIRYPVEPALGAQPSRPQPKRGAIASAPTLNWEAFDQVSRELDAKESKTVKISVMPGRQASTPVELQLAKKVTEVLLVEARGREPTRLERIKASLF